MLPLRAMRFPLQADFVVFLGMLWTCVFNVVYSKRGEKSGKKEGKGKRLFIFEKKLSVLKHFS